MAKRPWIGTSWKMNKVRAEARAFAEALAAAPIARDPAVQLFVVPPFPSIALTAEILAPTPVLVGAQNMHWQDQGTWTGEISPLMIRDCGARLVELGHSERRTHFGETDETVALKTAAAVRHGLVALVCIGDTKAEHTAGATAQALERQTRALLSGLTAADAERVMIAYEPVWSIGEGGVPADPDFANAQHIRIKALTTALVGRALPVLYGGSVNRDNCVALASRSAIDGLFIGRAAWDASGFIAIANAVKAAQSVEAHQNRK